MLIKEKVDADLAYRVSILFDEELGHGDTDEITRLTNDEDGVLVVIQDGALIGAASAHILTYDEKLTYTTNFGTYGMLDDSVVRLTSRGVGYGKRLVKLRLDWLRSQGVVGCFALAWDHPEEHRSEPVLLSAGFVELERRSNVWVSEGCPYCGESCICPAILMFKNMRSY